MTSTQDGDPFAANPIDNATTPAALDADLLLQGLRRRTAFADCVVIILYCIVARQACLLWYDAHVEPGRTVDLATAWMLPWVITSAAIPGLAALLTKRAALGGRALGLRWTGIEGQVLWGIAGAFLGYVALFAWIAMERLTRDTLHGTGMTAPWSWDAVHENAESLRTASVGSVVALLVIVAIAEETAFRGIVLPRLRRITGRWWLAVTICSALFGLMHLPGGFVAVVAAAFVSIAFCVVFIRARSLLAVVVAHFVFNVAQYTMGQLESGGG